MSAGWIGPDGRLAAGSLPRRDTAALRAAARDRACSVKVFCARCRGLLLIVLRGVPVTAVSVYGSSFDLSVAAQYPVPAGCRCPEPQRFDSAALRREAEAAPTRGYRTVAADRIRWLGHVD